MKLSGDPVALQRLFENENALAHGHDTPHRIVLIGTGGGMSCTRAAGYLTAFRDSGLDRGVDHAVTVSGSGGAMGAYLSGMPHRASQMFEQLGASGFIEQPKFKTPTLRLKFLADILRGQHSPLAFHEDRIRDHRTSWHVVATRLSGESLLIDAKTFAPDAAEAVLASSALPRMSEPIRARLAADGGAEGEARSSDELLIDGACGMPLPASAAIMKFRPDTVILLDSRPDPLCLPRFERYFWPTIMHVCLRSSASRVRKQMAGMGKSIRTEVDRLERLKRIKWCRISPDASAIPVTPFTMDPTILRRATTEARTFMHDALTSARPGTQV